MNWTNFDISHLFEKARSLMSSGLAGVHLAGIWPTVLLLVASVIIGLYGERLTRVLILGIFISVGALAGHQVAAWLSLPYWPTVILVGSMGGIFAFMLYRYALGLLLALSLSLACGAWSLGTHLSKQELSDVYSRLPEIRQADVQVPEVVTPTGSLTPAEAAKVIEWMRGLFQQVSDLRSNIVAKPEAQKHLVTMMLAGAAAGLLAGLVLGRAAAMLWTSLLAGAGVVAAVTKLAVLAQPQVGAWLSNNHQYVMGAMGGLAVLFLLRQAARPRASAVVVPVEVVASQDK